MCWAWSGEPPLYPVPRGPCPSPLQASYTPHCDGSVITGLHAFHSIVKACMLSSGGVAVKVCEHNDICRQHLAVYASGCVLFIWRHMTAPK